jgi:hypothetical protein
MPLPAPGPVSRVAPTAKIPDDAPIAPPTRPGPLSGQHPNVSYAPPAMPTPPPGSLQAPVIPPTSPQRSPFASDHPPQARGASRTPVDSGSSFSAGPPSPPLGLIAVVLIVDLVLAGTGAFLLAKGLSTPAAAAAKATPTPAAPAPAPTQKSEAAPLPAAPSPAPAVEAPAADVVAEQVPASKVEKPAKDAKASARRPSTPTVATPSSGKKPSTESEINAKVMGSHTAFGHCREQAGEVHGNIEIAFRVQGDGHVANVSVVEDTTGSPTLGACLRDAIATWNVTPHNGAPLAFVRPFTYP